MFLPFLRAVAVVLDFGTGEPLLHLQVGEGDVVANVRQLEDVGVLVSVSAMQPFF